MALRRELTTSVDSWAPAGTFKFDGSTSDLALQLYLRSQDGDEIAQLRLSSIPDTVTSRLSDVNVEFNDLDGFAQRAVLWDSGFAVTPGGDVKQIWTLKGLSMAEIALTLDEYEATECTAFNCTQPDGTAGYNNDKCTGTQMFTGVRCVVEEHEQSNQGLAMWSIGGESTTIPEIGLVKHTWTDSKNYKVYAVHTLSVTSERSYGDCPVVETYGYLNIPCYGTDDVPASEITVPTPSDWNYVHNNICAKKVLLTDKLEAKLASCESIATSPSSGAKVNSRQALWLAPEVLNGAPYSPAADIYSFGALLTELDTCEMPYFDARSKSGDAMGVSEIVALVKDGRLRPSFSAECPQFIRQLGEACCQQDPENRLTAQQIVQLLEGK
ncbi:hypothetical protein JG688_00016549 [Phytophthora aleatoria]|uniref:Protein kinase domain-containing protein n=1 Tax=Phytophthora aleatoria TaxID=2496075 RepID=A0A8J5IY48_9STRA|nr:hypothetical protein JG688_00016549 [Phytophthora aleatoria]